MSEFKRAYTYKEFIHEFGEIDKIDGLHEFWTTSMGINIYLSAHIIDSIKNNNLTINSNTVIYWFCVLVSEQQYDTNEYIDKWFLYMKPYFIPPPEPYDRSSVYIDGDSYKLIRRGNNHKITLEYLNNGNLACFEIVKVQIFRIIVRSGFISIITSKDEFTFKTETRRFFYSLIKVLQFQSPSGYQFVIHPNGDFCRLTIPHILGQVF